MLLISNDVATLAAIGEIIVVLGETACVEQHAILCQFYTDSACLL